jgi:hypothetical protein
MAAGHVVQVLQTQFSATETTTNSSSYFDTSLSLSITPTSTSSKIYVLCAPAVHFFNSSSTNVLPRYRIRNVTSGSDIYTSANRMDAGLSGGGTLLWGGNICLTALDSPASTSAQTYTFGMYIQSGTQVRINDDYKVSTITLMEIAQ